MEFKKENLLVSPKPTINEQTNCHQVATPEIRAMQLFKIAEFLNEYFEQKYCEEIFQMRCLWCRAQLDQIFFEQLTFASSNKDTEQRQKIMEELHVYVEDFLIAYSEEFFNVIDSQSQMLIIYAADFLHPRMNKEKLEKFFYISGLLQQKTD